MMRLLKLLILACFWATAAHAAAFENGEVLHFKIVQMGIKAGDATLTFVGPTPYHNQSTLLIVFKADGLNFYDEEKIYLDPATYKPLYVERDLNIFGSKEKISEDYVADPTAIVITKHKGDATPKVERLVKSGDTDNLYGFIYQYRLKGSFKIGESIPVKLPTKEITLALSKATQLKTPAGQFDCVFLDSVPAKYKIWFDLSERHLPLRISGAVGIGNTVMVLSEYSVKREGQ